MREYFPLLIPIIALMIPIVAILTRHQQKMAEILRQSHGNGDINALRHEIQELKMLVHQQAIALDNLTSGRTPLPPMERLENRLGVNG